jgi:hypothetical protein
MVDDRGWQQRALGGTALLLDSNFADALPRRSVSLSEKVERRWTGVARQPDRDRVVWLSQAIRQRKSGDKNLPHMRRETPLHTREIFFLFQLQAHK